MKIDIDKKGITIIGCGGGIAGKKGIVDAILKERIETARKEIYPSAIDLSTGLSIIDEIATPIRKKTHAELMLEQAKVRKIRNKKSKKKRKKK